MLAPLLCVLPAIFLQVAADLPAKWEVVQADTGGFIVSLARDSEGNVWIGTEDKGLLRVNPDNANPLLPGGQQFTRKDGAPDNAYALAVDPKGRAWAGSLRHGVSVFNGDKWRTYDVLDGPIGERIFTIAVCPTDGDVWIATSAGLSRYSPKNDSWSCYTRADGLPSDQANAIAFNAKGDLFVGTQCDGIAISRAADDYQKWNVVHGPASLPITPTGRGLPTALINGLLVSKAGTVCAATSAGLAWSKDNGKAWQYLRGKDYAAKVKGRFGGAPRGWQEAPKAVMDNLLPEDHVTCIAEDAAGLIWLGFRQLGYAALDPKTFRVVFRGTKKSEALPDDFVTCILPMPDYRPYIGTYGGGVCRAKKPMKAAGAKAEAKLAMKKGETAPPLPSPAKPPTLSRMNEMLAQLAKVPDRQPKAAEVLSLNDDWRTQGTWIDRYGRFSGVRCAMGGGGCDFNGGYMGPWFGHAGWIGRNCNKGDFLRYWVHWIKTDNPRSLQNSFMGGRKQAEWDDHGEVYPMTKDGPHVYGTIRLVKGQYTMGMYIFNKDGHDGMNRFRDYLVEVKSTPISKKQYDLLGFPGGEQTEAAFERSPIGRRGRVQQFWGGVYKRFYINVPELTCLTVRVNRSYSFNTILSGIFVDPVADLCGLAGPDRAPAPRYKPRFAAGDPPARDEESAALRLLDRLLSLRDGNSSWYAERGRPFRLTLLRAFLTVKAGEKSLAERIETRKNYPNLRQDIARCLHDVQLFDRRDRVYYSPENYESYSWDGATKAGDKWRKWVWDETEFEEFIKKRQALQSWR